MKALKIVGIILITALFMYLGVYLQISVIEIIVQREIGEA